MLITPETMNYEERCAYTIALRSYYLDTMKLTYGTILIPATEKSAALRVKTQLGYPVTAYPVKQFTLKTDSKTKKEVRLLHHEAQPARMALEPVAASQIITFYNAFEQGQTAFLSFPSTGEHDFTMAPFYYNQDTRRPEPVYAKTVYDLFERAENDRFFITFVENLTLVQPQVVAQLKLRFPIAL